MWLVASGWYVVGRVLLDPASAAPGIIAATPLMYFDFEDYRPDIARVERAISWREGLLLSIILHLVAVIVIIATPKLFPRDAEADRARLALFDLKRLQDEGRFVFVQPRLDPTAPKPPDRAEPSDKDREARAPEVVLDPENTLPFARGNTPERVEEPAEQAARGRGPEPEPAAGQAEQPRPPERPLPESQSALLAPLPPVPPGAGGRNATPGGSLGDSLRNLQRFIQSESFDNPRGGVSQFGPAIQFDTKGVEFGPWVRRFVAQVKRNWFIPTAAMMGMQGRVVITFNVHKSGVITDLTIVGPCPIESFNSAAFGALAASNPTQPLPPDYPADRAFFTVTFFYNESPQ